jgi:hypothetical protein
MPAPIAALHGRLRLEADPQRAADRSLFYCGDM